MSKFIIHGGKKLSGTIRVMGAKNAALKAFAASLLTRKTITINNAPEVEDIALMAELIKNLGVSVEYTKHGKYIINADKINSSEINSNIAKKLRASIVLAGPLLARTGKAIFPHPGGCVIGERPIDLFIDGFTALGAKVEHKNGLYTVSTGKNKLRGAKFVFSNISVTGTETLMMAGVLSSGTTELKNCACEPEIISLAKFLNSCGARIQGAGTSTIAIKGRASIDGSEYKTIPDRIEAGSFAILAAALGSSIKITDCNPDHLEVPIDVLKKIGVGIFITKNSLEIQPPLKLKSTGIRTREYPGFPTDLQAPFCVLLTQTEGKALVHETIYEGRLNWADELKRMGADILNLDPHRIEIRGPTKLRGREIESPDIRAGMAYIIAALCAEGQSVINNIYQIDRGYEKIEERMQKIGADIRRI